MSDTETQDILDVAYLPAEPASLADLGLEAGMIDGLVLRLLSLQASATASELSSFLCVPYFGVLQIIMQTLRETRLVEVLRGQYHELQWNYAITDAGRQRAAQMFEHCGYIGPVPVPLDQYTKMVRSQSIREIAVHEERLRAVFKDLVLDDITFGQIGPAVNSGRSVLLYGPPGNGKTSVCERIVRSLGGCIFVPHAIEVHGQIVSVFDEHSHKPVDPSGSVLLRPRHEEGFRPTNRYDKRMMLIHRPMLITGGDLTLDALDLGWNNERRFYEAPVHVKCNGGALLIDDFGRQKVSPQTLLDRWIVPLEKHVDFLTLRTGTKFEVPFDQLIVFSTNIEPQNLMDAAMMRRIRYKIPVGAPHRDAFRSIWARAAKAMGFASEDKWPDYLLDKHVIPGNRAIQASLPRDIIDYIDDACRYYQIPPTITEKLIDDAVIAYFVRETK